MLYLILLSVIDRGGIPASFIAGLLLFQKEASINLNMFYFACCFAGMVGDWLCYYFGSYMKSKWLDNETNIFQRKNIIRSKVNQYAVFVENHDFIWILASRLFPSINQFILFSAGYQKTSKINCLIAVILGNILWFGLFFILGIQYLKFLQENKVWIIISTGMLGIVTIYYFLLIIEKRIKK